MAARAGSIRASELWMQQEFCKEEQAMELYQKSKIQNMPKLTPDGKRKVLLDALTWKYDCVQQYFNYLTYREMNQEEPNRQFA